MSLTFEEIQQIDGVVINAECLKCTDLSRLEAIECERYACEFHNDRYIIRRDV